MTAANISTPARGGILAAFSAALALSCGTTTDWAGGSTGKPDATNEGTGGGAYGGANGSGGTDGGAGGAGDAGASVVEVEGAAEMLPDTFDSNVSRDVQLPQRDSMPRDVLADT